MDGSDFLEQAMNTQRSVASFMLRFTQDLWQDENGDPKVQWRGHINHIQGDEEIPFTDFTEALSFIQKQMQDLTLKAFPAADPGAQEKALAESFKLWEQFSANYTRLLFEAMEQTMQQSQDIGAQMSEAFSKTFSLWIPPAFRAAAGTPQPNKEKAAQTDAASAEMAEQIRNLTEQVRALSEKLEAQEK